MSVEPDLLSALAASAADVRHFGSPPDAVILRAIEGGVNTRKGLKEALGFDYNTIEQCLERNSAEIKTEQRGSIEVLERVPMLPAPREGRKSLSPLPARAATKASETAREIGLLQRDAPHCIKCRHECWFRGKPGVEVKWRCPRCGILFPGTLAVSAPVRSVEKTLTEFCVCGRPASHRGPCSKKALEASGSKEPEAAATLTCIDCGGPRSVGSAARCRSCFHDRAVERASNNSRTKAETQMPQDEKQEPIKPDNSPDILLDDEVYGLDLSRVEEVMATAPTVAAGARELGLSTVQLRYRRNRNKELEDAVTRGRDRFYGITEETDVEETIAEEEVALCGCGRLASHPGVCTYRRTNKRSNMQSLQVAEPLQDEQSKRYGPFCERNCDPSTVGHHERCAYWRETSAQEIRVGGSIEFSKDVEVRVEEMRRWTPEQITEFFTAVAKLVEIPSRATIEFAWSPDLEDTDPEGMSGMTQLYLCSLLHDSMAPHEKEAVWTLLLYIKRIEALVQQKKRDEKTS